MESSDMTVVETAAEMPAEESGLQEAPKLRDLGVPDEQPSASSKKEPMNGREGITGFVAWLMTHDIPHVFGTSTDNGHTKALVGAFCVANDLPECRDGLEEHLVAPSKMTGNAAGEGHDVDALADFLMAQFAEDFGGMSKDPSEVTSEGAVTMAKRLLLELKRRRRSEEVRERERQEAVGVKAVAVSTSQNGAGVKVEGRLDENCGCSFPIGSLGKKCHRCNGKIGSQVF